MVAGSWRRLCDHAATISGSTVPQIQFVDSGWLFLQRRVPTVQTVQPIVEIPQVPLLDRFLTCPLLCNAVRSLRVEVVDISVVAQVQIPLVPLKLVEILQLQSIDKVVDVCCTGPAVLGCSRGGDSRAPTVAARFAWTLSLPCPSLCNDSCRGSGQKTVKVPQLQYVFVVDVPVVQVDIWVRPVLGQGR